MLSRGLGGIQQSFLDYSRAMKREGITVIDIISTKAMIEQSITADYHLPNLASWCPLSKIYLAFLVHKLKPDIIIAHGGRAITFARFAQKFSSTRIVGISHNYAYKRLSLCDYVIVLTDHLRTAMLNYGIPADKLFNIPNMIDVSVPYKEKSFSPKNEIIIGSFGRFVEKKGFQDLILAINMLKSSGCKVKLLLGGGGDYEPTLVDLVKKLDLEDVVEFYGWVDDKQKFFDSIDIFVLSSKHEPFGIIVLEAMLYSSPIISTRSEGPSEIIRDEQDGLLASNEDINDLVAKISLMINNPELAKAYTMSAYLRLQQEYDSSIVSKKISDILNKIYNSNK
jgi:glycosyltransferase involved in cell wall biosynthesis